MDKDAFKTSLEKIAERHEILRTIFPSQNGKPFQSISGKIDFDFTIEKLPEAKNGYKDEQIRKIAADEALKPFDLARGPLIRAKLLKINDTEHIFLKTTHHIINDRWSDSIFVKELALIKKSNKQGKQEQKLPELPVQYADFAYF